MSKVTQQEKAVAARLRHEIAASRPAFSEGLHGRLCRAIEQQQADAPRSRGQQFLRWLPVAAAACLLATVCIGWHVVSVVRDAGIGSHGTATAQKTGIDNATDLAIQVVAKADAVLDGAVNAQRWAYLDHDARIVSAMPAARLPFDVVASLLSVKRHKDSRIPLTHHASPLGRNTVREQTGVRDG